MTAIHGLLPLPTDYPHVYAFEISPRLDAEGLRQMGQCLNGAFDRHPGKINLLLRFRDFDPATARDRSAFDGIEAEVRSLNQIGRLATLNAPDAPVLTQVLDKIIPVPARRFAAGDSRAAWQHVNGRDTENA